MKSISPFQVPRLLDLDNQTATSIESHFKVIETISDYQESKALRARLFGAISSLWSMEANCSALDSAKVNSKDIFGYYSLLFTKSRVVVSSSTLSKLPLTRDADRAIRSGRFRESYGDMIVVGYITGGEAEAVMHVTSFQENHRASIRRALRLALQDSAFNKSGGPRAVGELLSEFDRSTDDMQALQDATTTLLSRRTGVTHPDQLQNPNNFPQLLAQLTKAAENTGVKISALCYRVEMFSQVPVDVLGFARAVVDENVSVLQKQFAQLQFINNSCEVHLAPGATGDTPDRLLHELRKLQNDVCAAMQRFAAFKGYRDVGQLSAGDSARSVGSAMVQRFEDLCEKMRAAKVKAAALQQLAGSLQARRPEAELIVAGGGRVVEPWANAPPSPAPSACLPAAYAPTPAPMSVSYIDGWLHGRLLAGRGFNSGRFKSVQPYAVVKLDGKTFISPVLSSARTNNIGTFPWLFDFHLEVPAKLLLEDAAVVIAVYNKGTFKADKYLGAVSVPLRQACGRAAQLGVDLLRAMVADGDRSKPTWFPVERVDSGKYKSRGELQLALRFSTDMPVLQQEAELSLKAQLDGDEIPRTLMRPLTDNLRPAPSLTNPPSTPTLFSIPSQPLQPATSMTLPVPLPLFSDGSDKPVMKAATTVIGYPTVLGSSATAGVGPSGAGVGPSCGSVTGGVTGGEAPASDSEEGGSEYRSEAHDSEEEKQEVRVSRRHSTACNQGGGGSGDGGGGGGSSGGGAGGGGTRKASAAAAEQPPAAANAVLSAPVSSLRSTPSVQKGSVGVLEAASGSGESQGPGLRASTPPQRAGGPPPAEGGQPPCRRLEEREPKRQQSRKQEGCQKEQAWESQTARAGKGQEEAAAQPERRGGRGLVGGLVGLVVTGAVLGSVGAAAVLAGHRCFGVDLVEQSKRLAAQYGTAARCTTAAWAHDGGRAMGGWTRTAGERIRWRVQQLQEWRQQRRQQQQQQKAVEGGEGEGSTAAAGAGDPGKVKPETA